MSDDFLRSQLRPFRIRSLTIRWLHYLVPLILIGLAIHLLLPQFANLKDSWQTVEQMPGWLVACAAMAEIASYFGSGYLLAALAAMLQEQLSILRGILITLAGGSIGMVAGGMVGSTAAIYGWALNSGVSKKTAGLCSTIPSLFNNLLLTIISIFGLFHLLLIHELTALQGASFGLILGALVFIVASGLWGVTHPAWLLKSMTKIGEWWAKVRQRPYSLDATTISVNQLINTWLILRSGGWRGPLIGTLMTTGFDMLTLGFLFRAAGYAITPGVLLAGYGLPLLIGKVSFLPGGVGIIEATMTAIYVSMGVPAHVAVVVTLTYRLLSFWIPALLGFLAAAYLHWMFHTTQ